MHIDVPSQTLNDEDRQDHVSRPLKLKTKSLNEAEWSTRGCKLCEPQISPTYWYLAFWADAACV